ncbi:MAG: M18 family aminopeptidase, partial [SAR324 cluster bacterium]|nr:M18 family aminopeptidase [SAR324 cluster bacterium]
MTKQQILKELMTFLVASPTPFHAVSVMTDRLNNCGYKQLFEGDKWRLKKGEGYYLTRGGSSLIAFRLGKIDDPVAGIRIVGAHSDSPGLKIKTNPLLQFKNYINLGVEVYGSPILNTWFDRDLSIAGRIAYTDTDRQTKTALIDFKRPVAVLPNLPIHLTPVPAEKEKINRQTELPPVLMQFETKIKSEKQPFQNILMAEVKKQLPELKIKAIDDCELYFYDTQPPATVGYNNEFLCAGKLDNLVSCFLGMQALTNSTGERTSMLVCNDHEEVGSNSYTGAAGPLLKSVLERVLKNRENYFRAISRSLLVSVDNAHGVHPNYPQRYDGNHGPLLNKGPVIKVNANQRYATNAETSSIFRRICREVKVPVQEFVNRSDLNCGSTIGPISSTNLGIRTLDVGVPTFAMHSIRETCGCQDI